jgi:hypothetical protein
LIIAIRESRMGALRGLQSRQTGEPVWSRVIGIPAQFPPLFRSIDFVCAVETVSWQSRDARECSGAHRNHQPEAQAKAGYGCG